MRLAIIVTAALAILLTGCQQSAPTAAEKAPAATAAPTVAPAPTAVPTAAVQAVPSVQVKSPAAQAIQKDDTITVKGKDGEAVTVSSGLPDAMKSFPVPQGFSPDSSGSGLMIAGGGQKMNAGLWTGKASVQSVGDFYKKTMADQGWKQEAIIEMGDATQLTYTKGQEQAILTVSKEEDNVKIQVIVASSN